MSDVRTGARAIRILLGIAVSAGLLYLVLRNISPSEILSHLRRTHWGWLALAVASNLAIVGARGIRWGSFYHPAAPAPWPLVSATAIGFMGNNLLPLRAGELLRAYLAARSARLSFWTAMATLVVERVLDALSILLILGAVVLLVPVPQWLKAAALVFLVLDIAAMGALILLARDRGRLAARIMRIPRLGATLTRWLSLFSVGLQSLRPGPHLAPLLAWTLVIWLVTTAAVWAALHAGGLVLPFSAALTVLAFSGIGVSIPSAPGYVGTLQFFVVQALAIYAVTGVEAVSFSFLYHASSFIPMTLLGWACLIAEGVSLGEVAQEAQSQAHGS